MKAILIILVVALGGLTYKYQLDAKSAKSKMIAAEDAEHAAKTEMENAASELAAAKRKISTLEAELDAANTSLSDAKNQLVAAEERFSKRVEDAQTASDTLPDAAQVVANIEARRDAELKALDEKYQAAMAQVATQKATLVANQEKANLTLKSLKDNPPSFSEQRANTDDGRSVGIRTSQADRKEVLEKYQASLDALTDQIAAMKGEELAVKAREKAIQETYRAEQSRISSKY